MLAEKVGQPVDQRVCGFENEGLWLNVDRGLAYLMRIELSRVVIFAHREAEPLTTPGDLLVRPCLTRIWPWSFRSGQL